MVETPGTEGRKRSEPKSLSDETSLVTVHEAFLSDRSQTYEQVLDGSILETVMVRNGVRTTNKYGPSNPVTESGRVLGDDSPALIALFTLVSIESGDGKFRSYPLPDPTSSSPSFLGRCCGFGT